MWDLEAAIKELEWARDAGLRGVNFPAMRDNLPPYNSRSWEPLWRACESLHMPLATHTGNASPFVYEGVEAIPLRMLEESHMFGYRTVHWMVFAGIFERFPHLKFVITEIAGDWFSRYLAMIDDVWRAATKLYPSFRAQVPRPASEYCLQNVCTGASFLARFEAEAAVRDGYVDQVMWGSDYPHIEGTWQKGFDYHGETATHLALRNTFAGIPEQALRRMAGENAADVYGLDLTALQAVAARIQAPTPNELAVRPSEIPESLCNYAFRTSGTFT